MLKLYITIVVLVGLLISSAEAGASRTDVVRLPNGDEVTGEIKSLTFGVLSYGTDSMGTVSIEWEDIVRIQSGSSLQVELTNGKRHFGSLKRSGTDYRVIVVSDSGETVVPTADIVRITPIETDDSILSRLDGSISVGFDTQKSSEVTTFNLASDISYRALDYLVRLTANASITDQPGQPNSERSQLGLNYQRFRKGRWFTDWFATWETNQQLGIANRYIVGGGPGRYLVQTNRNELSLAVGINATRESFVGDEESTTVAEGRLQFRYLHRNLTPESQANLTTTVYPLLSNLSSFRSETDLSFRREFIDDLFLDLTFFHSYSSDPPPGALLEDYGVTTSIGYSW
jgi:putative salt-induced outer membrane protein YdiY